MKKIDFAHLFTNLGISVIPLWHRSKEPMLPVWKPYTTLLSSEVEVEKWLQSDWNNYAVICGWNNLVVIDFDTLEWFDLWRAFMQSINMLHIVETSFKVVTNHGIHVYLQTATPTIGRKRNSIDVQGVGRYVVGPGCTHPNGTLYVPVGGLKLIAVESIEQVLPVEYFPLVANDNAHYIGAPVAFTPTTTEYQYDPLQIVNGGGMDLITKVKQAVRIESLFANLKQTSTDGRWFAAQCPFHDDNRPSLWIDIRSQLAGCQVCNMRPMDVINVYARMHSVSESVAVSRLAEEIGVWR